MPICTAFAFDAETARDSVDQLFALLFRLGKSCRQTATVQTPSAVRGRSNSLRLHRLLQISAHAKSQRCHPAEGTAADALDGELALVGHLGSASSLLRSIWLHCKRLQRSRASTRRSTNGHHVGHPAVRPVSYFLASSVSISLATWSSLGFTRGPNRPTTSPSRPNTNFSKFQLTSPRPLGFAVV